MESLKELYRIGPGPSSSHSLGVRNACLYYQEEYSQYTCFIVELYGSLGLTGKGHMSDKVIQDVFGKDNVLIRFYREQFKQPNTMVFYTYDNGKKENEMIIYSVGGGKILVDGQVDLVKDVYLEKNLTEIIELCKEKHYTLADYVYYYEPEIKDYLMKIVNQMLDVCKRGINETGVLPGELKIEKIAKNLHYTASITEDPTIKEKLLITSYAYAAMEENACGNMVVTAPTLGSSGVLAALVTYYYDMGISKSVLANGLAAAGVIGNVVKTNASISGASGGCQAEVGTACAMGAAFVCYVNELTNSQIEYASEIAIEHHLGLTCDPIGGYVQIPCIERNGQAALRSMDAYLYAKVIGKMRKNKISFDTVVETMKYTGQKLSVELKETSLGGLAIEYHKMNNQQ